MINFISKLKFIFVKLNIFFRYNKKKIFYAIRWIFFGKEISNFTYEIKNEDELINTIKNITGLKYKLLKKIYDEIDFKSKNFTKFFSPHFFKNFPNKNIFGRRMLWYLLARTLKPDVIIESGVDKKLGSALLIYALSQNYKSNKKKNKFIGIDIKNEKFCYFNIKNKIYKNFIFCYQDSLQFLSKYKERKKILYISDAKHDFKFELKEFNLIKKRMKKGSVIVSDNNSGSLFHFSNYHNKKVIYFHEIVKNFWYKGAVTIVSYFY